MINVVLEPSAKGFSKYCYLRYLTINLDFMASEHEKEEDYYYEVEMPVGMFSDAQVTTPCGMTGENGPLNKSDDPRSFFAPQRKEAELLWFTTGYVTYAFPLHLEKGFQPKELLLSFEICSEAPGFKTDYLSDITFRINGIKVTTYRSPGDFGGRRGYRSPDYWPIQCTQFGLLKTIRITEEGAFLDDKLVNPDLKISTLNLLNSDNLKFTVAVEDDVIYKGGVNLFGKHFGDFHQSIKLIIR